MKIAMTKPRPGMDPAIASVDPDAVETWEAQGWTRQYPPDDWPKGKAWPPKPKPKLKKDAD